MENQRIPSLSAVTKAQSNAPPIPFDNPRRPLMARNRIPKLASGYSEYSKEERHSNWWNSGRLISSLVAGEPLYVFQTLYTRRITLPYYRMQFNGQFEPKPTSVQNSIASTAVSYREAKYSNA